MIKTILLIILIIAIVITVVIVYYKYIRKPSDDKPIKPLKTTRIVKPAPWDIWCFSGGGTRAMSQSIGLIFGLASIYHKTSAQIFTGSKIIAANSGGSWFLSMLGYSPTFNKMINDVSKGSSPSTVYYKFYVQKLRALNLPNHYDNTIKILNSLGLSSYIDNIEGELYELKQFIGVPWLNVIRDWIFKPFNNELSNVKLTDDINKVTMNKSMIFCSGVLTNAMVGATDAAKLTGLDYATDTPFIRYDINGHKNPKTSIIPIMFSNNQQLFLSSGNIKVTYNAFTYKLTGSDVNTSISTQVQHMNSNTTVVGASSSSSAAVGFLSSEHFVNSLFQKLWSGDNVYASWLIGNWLTEYFRNFAPALTIYPDVKVKNQGCISDSDCVTGNWPTCVCNSPVNCPDAPFKRYNEPPNYMCQRDTVYSNCVCKNNSTGSTSRGEPLVTVDGQFNEGNSYQSTEAAARLALRTMDGGLLDNSSISYSVRGYQQLYPNNKKARIFALSSSDKSKNMITNKEGGLCPIDIAYLFGFSHNGEKIPPNQNLIDYLEMPGDNLTSKIAKKASGVLLVPNPTIFEYKDAKPIYTYPKNKEFVSHGNTKCRILRYNTTSVNNNNFGIVKGLQIELTVLMIVSEKAGDIPITLDNFNAMTEIVDDIYNILKNNPQILNEINITPDCY